MLGYRHIWPLWPRRCPNTKAVFRRQRPWHNLRTVRLKHPDIKLPVWCAFSRVHSVWQYVNARTQSSQHAGRRGNNRHTEPISHFIRAVRRFVGIGYHCGLAFYLDGAGIFFSSCLWPSEEAHVALPIGCENYSPHHVSTRVHEGRLEAKDGYGSFYQFWMCRIVQEQIILPK